MRIATRRDSTSRAQHGLARRLCQDELEPRRRHAGAQPLVRQCCQPPELGTGLPALLLADQPGMARDGGLRLLLDRRQPQRGQPVQFPLAGEVGGKTGDLDLSLGTADPVGAENAPR